LTTTEAACNYTDLGFSIIPISERQKGPVISEWQKKEFKPEDFKQGDNIGIKTGQVSGGLVDIDCDCPEAVTAAAFLLPETPMKHGRKSNPTSHYWYRVRGAEEQ
jgi:hypothetical protein